MDVSALKLGCICCQGIGECIWRGTWSLQSKTLTCQNIREFQEQPVYITYICPIMSAPDMSTRAPVTNQRVIKMRPVVQITLSPHQLSDLHLEELSCLTQAILPCLLHAYWRVRDKERKCDWNVFGGNQTGGLNSPIDCLKMTPGKGW